MLISRLLRVVLVLVAAWACGACANLEAVRDFAATSSRLTAYRQATAHYAGTADRQLADTPDTPEFSAIRERQRALDKQLAAQQKSLLALHHAATGYMRALARLAGDDSFELSGDMNLLGNAIEDMPALGVNTEHVQAYSKLAASFTDWALAARQAGHVREMVQRHGDAMDKVLEAMAFAVGNYQRVLRNERAALDAEAELRRAAWQRLLPGEAGQADTRRLLVLQLAQRSDAMVTREQQQADALVRRAVRGVEWVRTGHDAMRRNLDRLDGPQLAEVLRRCASQLKEVQAQMGALD